MQMRKLVPRGFLRSYILRLLTKEPRHGYDIMKSIEEKTGWKPSPGAIYPTLHEMERRGLIKKEKVGRRFSYKLTRQGKELSKKLEKTTKEMRERLNEFAEVMSEIVGFKLNIRFYRRKEFMLLPNDIKKCLLELWDLITKIAKEKKKVKELKKILLEEKKKLKILEKM